VTKERVTSTGVFHGQDDILTRFSHLKELYNVGVMKQFQKPNLSLDANHVRWLFDARLVNKL
jgi:hypothetical protein